MKSADIRKAFLHYFESQGHRVVPSSSLVPENDPTLLFTNAGMVQFKDLFLGKEKRDYQRAASSQRCVRAGGKHNDLDNVGYTARHHTFFEMLGNFSFGDYFKREAIRFAWEFLTTVLGLPPEKLWVTIYQDDDEAADIWLNELKVSPDRFSRCGEADNFWAMGDTGPCGPCTEIFYDHGPDVAGGPPGSPEQDGDRYIEIWNLVFMQYDRAKSGELIPLPKPSVDTGMGLERVSAVMQGVHNNYEIDLFQPIIRTIAEIAHEKDLTHPSLKVIADHIRSTAFLICDGVIPSNDDRGYVLRRIMRRAIRHGNKLGIKETFFYRLVEILGQQMGEAYPVLIQQRAMLEKVILQEEEQFARTLEQGLKILANTIASLTDNRLSGEILFKLSDTYGFPVDLTGDIARERGLQMDLAGYETLMEKQRDQSKAASQFSVAAMPVMAINDESVFSGYEAFSHSAHVLRLFVNGESVTDITGKVDAMIVLDRTPFYAESGGQIGDTGVIFSEGMRFVVKDTQKYANAILHVGHLEKGSISIGTTVHVELDEARRRETMANHSATHLLHAALREILGEHVMQKGSLVEPERLRFDFTHGEALSQKQIHEVEDWVNEKIRYNESVITDVMAPEQAFESGAIGLFGDKYGDKVRVLSMGRYSKELCGGTHVARTGDIGYFKIVEETSSAAGIRRIEAVTGLRAEDFVQHIENKLMNVASQLKSKVDDVPDKLSQLLEKNRELEKRVDALQAKLTSQAGNALQEMIREIKGVRVLAAKLPATDSKALRQTLDQFKDKFSPCVIVLAAVEGDKLSVVAGVTPSLVGQVPSAKLLVQHLCGKGGGRDDMAQGGGICPENIDDLIEDIYTLISK